MFNFFLTIAYAINTAIPVITHEIGYTFISTKTSELIEYGVYPY